MMRKISSILLFAGIILASTYAYAEFDCEKPVQTGSGLIRGASEKEAKVCQ